MQHEVSLARLAIMQFSREPCCTMAGHLKAVGQADAYLGVRVVRAGEVRLVGLLEALARALGKVLVVMEDAACGVCGQVDLLLEADVGQVEHAQHIHPDGLQLHAHT